MHRVRPVERKLARYAQIIFFEPFARVQRRDENRRKLRELAPQLRAAAAGAAAQNVRNAAHHVHAVAEHDEVADAGGRERVDVGQSAAHADYGKAALFALLGQKRNPRAA